MAFGLGALAGLAFGGLPGALVGGLGGAGLGSLLSSQRGTLTNVPQEAPSEITLAQLLGALPPQVLQQLLGNGLNIQNLGFQNQPNQQGGLGNLVSNVGESGKTPGGFNFGGRVPNVANVPQNVPRNVFPTSFAGQQLSPGRVASTVAKFPQTFGVSGNNLQVNPNQLFGFQDRVDSLFGPTRGQGSNR